MSLRDLSEMMLDRELELTHESVRTWETRFDPLIRDFLGLRRRGLGGESWYVDETYIKVKGRWCYLYRAITRDGTLIDYRLSESRDMTATRSFFRRALEQVGEAPDRVTSDKEASYPGAISKELGQDVKHRTSQYLNNMIEQDHRGIKQRYDPMRGFYSFACAKRFCETFDELRKSTSQQSDARESL